MLTVIRVIHASRRHSKHSLQSRRKMVVAKSTSSLISSWQPSKIGSGDSQLPYSVIVLNHCLDDFEHGRGSVHGLDIFSDLWSKAKQRVAVDGGANYLTQTFSEKLFSLANKHPPHIVCGDFDSINVQTKEKFFKSTTTKVVPTPDQNATDFTKAVRLAVAEDSSLKYIVAIWSSSGRIDHVLAIIDTLYKSSSLGIPVFLYHIDNSFSWLLDKGEHKIETDPLADWCSLVPVGHACKVTTTGLKWNLSDGLLEFGTLISSSNQFDKNCKEVTVTTDYPILFSMDMSNSR